MNYECPSCGHDRLLRYVTCVEYLEGGYSRFDTNFASSEDTWQCCSCEAEFSDYDLRNHEPDEDDDDELDMP